MSYHDRGPHKNSPGASAGVYQPLADLFGRPQRNKDQVSLELETVEGAQRGVMVCRGQRLYIYLIWQEEWTSNPLAWTKYVQGKIVYQKDVRVMEFFTLPYRIEATLTLTLTRACAEPIDPNPNLSTLTLTLTLNQLLSREYPEPITPGR